MLGLCRDKRFALCPWRVICLRAIHWRRGNEQARVPARPASLAERRRFLKALGAAAVAPLLGASAAPAALAAPTAVAGPGGVFLVNGWVLTRADLDVLGLRAA